MPFPVSPNPGDSYTDAYGTVWIYAGSVNGWYRQTVVPNNDTTYTGGGGSGSATATGAAGEIQFTDGTNLDASPNLVWDDANDELEVTGDLKLLDGGSWTTTLQTITPTQNNTISLPNATGTLALVAGSSGQLVYNNAGVYAGIPGSTVGASGNVTLNAASGFTGNLLDLQLNGTSQVSSSATGVLKATGFAANGTNTPRSFALGDSTSTRGLEFFTGGNRLYYREGSTTVCSFGLSSGLLFSTSQPLGWCPTSSDGTADLLISRDDADKLAQRRGNFAQTFRVYNTHTSSSEYERGKLEWSGNVFRIGTEKGSGGGTARALEFQTDGTTRLTVDTSGGLLANAASGFSGNLLDLQVNGTSQLRVNQQGDITSGGGNTIVPDSRGYRWSTRGGITAPSDGTVQLTNNAGTGFSLLRLGGGTTSFPAIKRNNAELQARLADDSGYTTIDAQHRLQGTAPATASSTGTAGDIRYDADYIYVCTATNTWKRAALTTW